jgi:hypothetical protein
MLPRFAFESEEQGLIITEHLFRKWQQDDKTQCGIDDQKMDETVRKNEEQDIVVGVCHCPPGPLLTLAADHMEWPKRS